MKFEYRSFEEEDLSFVSPSLYKKDPNEIYFPTPKDTITISKNNQIVAFIDLAYEACENIYRIDLFEVFDPGNGIGTQIIEEIQQCEKISCIELNPNSQQSNRFWFKMGFKFINNDTMRWKKG